MHWGVEGFGEMTNLPKALRNKLEEQCTLTALRVERKQVSKLDGTIKVPLEAEDDNCVETVLMRYHHGNTVCVSSEIGCAMGCAFCASTIGGLVRRLTPAEILSQVIFTQKDSGLPISNIVLMGIGEPLDNFDNNNAVLGTGQPPRRNEHRHTPYQPFHLRIGRKIDKLADLQLQLTLSVSLHAPDDATRSSIMPVNRAVGVDRLFESCRRYLKNRAPDFPTNMP